MCASYELWFPRPKTARGLGVRLPLTRGPFSGRLFTLEPLPQNLANTPHKPLVAGSIPASGTIINQRVSENEDFKIVRTPNPRASKSRISR